MPRGPESADATARAGSDQIQAICFTGRGERPSVRTADPTHLATPYRRVRCADRSAPKRPTKSWGFCFTLFHGRYSAGLLGVRPLGRDFHAEARTPTSTSTVKRFGRSRRRGISPTGKPCCRVRSPRTGRAMPRGPKSAGATARARTDQIRAICFTCRGEGPSVRTADPTHLGTPSVGSAVRTGRPPRAMAAHAPAIWPMPPAVGA